MESSVPNISNLNKLKPGLAKDDRNLLSTAFNFHLYILRSGFQSSLLSRHLHFILLYTTTAYSLNI